MSRSSFPVFLDQSADPIRAAIDVWPACVFLMGIDGFVIDSNAAARALLARGPVLSLDAGKIRFRRQEEGSAFRNAAERALAERATRYLCLQRWPRKFGQGDKLSPPA